MISNKLAAVRAITANSSCFYPQFDEV